MSFGDSSYVQASPAELAQAQQQLTDWNKLKPVFQKNASASLARAENADQRNSMRQGGIAASTSQILDANQQAQNYGLMRSGAAPTSGKFMMANSGNGRGIGLGRALSRGVVNNETSYLQGMAQQIQNGQSLLRGTDAARNSIAGLDTQRGMLSVMSSNATKDAIGQGIGAGIGAFATAGGFSGGAPSAESSGGGYQTTSGTNVPKGYFSSNPGLTGISNPSGGYSSSKFGNVPRGTFISNNGLQGGF